MALWNSQFLCCGCLCMYLSLAWGCAMFSHILMAATRRQMPYVLHVHSLRFATQCHGVLLVTTCTCTWPIPGSPPAPNCSSLSILKSGSCHSPLADGTTSALLQIILCKTFRCASGYPIIKLIDRKPQDATADNNIIIVLYYPWYHNWLLKSLIRCCRNDYVRD